MSRAPARPARRALGAALGGVALAATLVGCAARSNDARAASRQGAAETGDAVAPKTDSAPGGAGLAGSAADYRVYVGTESADAVSVVDPAAWDVVKRIPVGISVEDIEGVHGLAVAPDGRHWYISLAHGFPYGTLWKFATGGDSLVAKTELGNFPATIGITPDGAWAFVANYNLHGDKAIDTISAVYTPTMTQVTQIPACVKPHGLDISRDGRTVVVTCTRDDTILTIDVHTLREASRGSVRLPEEEAAGKDCYATGVAVMPEGDRAYVSCGHANDVRAVDLATLAVTDRIEGCAGAYLLELEPAARRLWVPCRSGQEFVVIDTGTNEIVGRVPTTREFPHTVAFTPDGRFALLSQESRGVVPGALDVVDRETLERTATLDVGLQATGVGIAPAAVGGAAAATAR